MAIVSRLSYSSAACRTAASSSSGCQGFFRNWKMCPWLIAAMIDSRSANPVKSIRIACGCRALSLVKQLDARDLRHPLVGHHDVHFLLLHDPVALLGAMRLEDPELAAEQVVHRVADIGLVIHDQHAVPGGWHVEANSATLVPDSRCRRSEGRRSQRSRDDE